MNNASAVSSYWIKSGTYTFLLQLTSIGFSFGGFFILVRQLSKEDFGVWSLFLAITSLVEVTRNGLIQNAQIKYSAATADADYRKILTASFALNFVFCGLVALIFLLTARSIGQWSGAPRLEPMLVFYILTLLASLPGSQFNFIQQANLDLRGVFVTNFIRQGFFFFTILALSLWGISLHLMQLTFLMTGFAALASGVAYLQSRKYLRFSKSLDAGWMKQLYNYGKFSLGTSLGSTLSGIINQILLSSVLSPASLAVFGTVSRVNTLAEVPVSTLATIVFPQSAIRAEKNGKDSVRHLYEKSVAWLLAFNIPAVIFVEIFAHEIIWLIAGEAYIHAVPYLRVSILLMLLVPFTRQFGTVMDSLGKPDINFYLLLFNAVTSVVLCYTLLRLYGLIGVFWGSLFSLMTSVVINSFFLRRELDVKFWNVFRYVRLFYTKDIVTITVSLFRFMSARRSIHP